MMNEMTTQAEWSFFNSAFRAPGFGVEFQATYLLAGASQKCKKSPVEWAEGRRRAEAFAKG
jgi:hypothetical protein